MHAGMSQNVLEMVVKVWQQGVSEQEDFVYVTLHSTKSITRGIEFEGKGNKNNKNKITNLQIKNNY